MEERYGDSVLVALRPWNWKSSAEIMEMDGRSPLEWNSSTVTDSETA